MVAVLVLMAWALLLGAWVVTNAPFAAPDEAEHYVRAVGISEGHLIGRSDPSARIGVDPRQIAWTRQATRLVTLPPGLDPRPFACATGSGDLSAACLITARADPSSVTLPTAVGNYQPLPYLLPAAVMRMADSAPDALRLARAADALLAFGLLAVALLALFDVSDPAQSIVGLLLAVTPMVLFCGASLNGSGLEIAAGVAFFSCVLRVGRSDPVERRWWVATAITGAALALSRPASPVWVFIALGVAAIWDGRWAFALSWLRDRAGWCTAGAILVAIALSRVWEGLYGSHIPIDTGSLHAGLVAGVHEWWRALPELVGKFGYLDVKLPVVLPVLWFALILALLAVAGRGRRRERLILAVLIVSAVCLPAVFYALITRPTGFGLQGRQLLPVLVILPLLAGEACYRRRAAVRGRFPLVRLAPAGVAVVQVAAWYVNARRFAVGSAGPIWFLPHASWTPPAGWTVWLAAVALAGVCLLAVSLMDGRRSRFVVAA